MFFWPWQVFLPGTSIQMAGVTILVCSSFFFHQYVSLWSSLQIKGKVLRPFSFSVDLKNYDDVADAFWHIIFYPGRDRLFFSAKKHICPANCNFKKFFSRWLSRKRKPDIFTVKLKRDTLLNKNWSFWGALSICRRINVRPSIPGRNSLSWNPASVKETSSPYGVKL